MKKLFFVSFICFIFMGLEFAGGIISNSLAILTDAAHMFSDVAGFMISFFSIYISKNKSTFNYSMGYHRAEILGAFVSIFLIWGLLGWLNVEATRRLRNPGPPIDPDIMLITACIGFACNLTNFCALNASCGKAEEEEEEGGDIYKSNLTARSYKSLSRSLMAVYQPHQAHKCIRNEKTMDSQDEIESCHDEECGNEVLGSIREESPGIKPI
jgi:cation diffusion facilitator family transporter